MVYKIVSWDVGIKNLAYCILSKNDDVTDYQITKWDIINLIDSKNDLICCNEKCKHKANLYCEKDPSKYVYCGKHKLNHDLIHLHHCLLLLPNYRHN